MEELTEIYDEISNNVLIKDIGIQKQGKIAIKRKNLITDYINLIKSNLYVLSLIIMMYLLEKIMFKMII